MEVKINSKPGQTVEVEAVVGWLNELGRETTDLSSQAAEANAKAVGLGIDDSARRAEAAMRILGRKEVLASMAAKLISAVESTDTP